MVSNALTALLLSSGATTGASAMAYGSPVGYAGTLLASSASLARIACVGVAIVYPAYKTHKALQLSSSSAGGLGSYTQAASAFFTSMFSPSSNPNSAAYQTTENDNVRRRYADASVNDGDDAYEEHDNFGLIDPNDPRNTKEFWLTYWMTYGAFTTVERTVDTALSWVPLYHHAKLGFLIWLQWPSEAGGAARIYHNAVKPALEEHEHEIDGAVHKVERELANAVKRNEKELRYVADTVAHYARSAWHGVRDTIDAVVAPNDASCRSELPPPSPAR